MRCGMHVDTTNGDKQLIIRRDRRDATGEQRRPAVVRNDRHWLDIGVDFGALVSPGLGHTASLNHGTDNLGEVFLTTISPPVRSHLMRDV